MMTKEFKEGDIRPVYQQVGYEVCKKTSEKEVEQVWVQVDKLSEAEVLSFIFGNRRKKKE